MDTTAKKLWLKISSLNLDDPTARLPFSVRLARENGWSLRYAMQVIEEYRRFLFLTVTADHVICPSEDVDVVWHLHLCYTRSYWHDFCQKILGKPLHHDPTRGGPDQLEYHRMIYEQTLESYQDYFQETAPHDIWPNADERFKHVGQHRTVDTSQYWIFPKLRLSNFLSSRFRKSFFRFGALAIVPMLGVAWNPLEMNGKQFLGLYIPLLIISTIAAAILRRVLQDTDDGAPLPDLNHFDIAVLAGGERQAQNFSLAKLFHEGYLKFNPDDGGKTIQVEKPIEGELHPLSKAQYKNIEHDVYGTLTGAWIAGQPKAAEISAKLEKKGLLADTSIGVARIIPTLLMGSIALLGVLKIIVGISRDKPVGFLIILTILAGIISLFFMKKFWRTPRGERALEELKRENKKIDSAMNLPDTEHELQMQWGLYGPETMLLAGGSLAGLHTLINKEQKSNTAGCSGVVGCASGCGGDGCGGGGGCGSGCGGCGGD